jgi:hypothetical protein
MSAADSGWQNIEEPVSTLIMPTYAGVSFSDGQQQAQGQWNAAGGGMVPLPSSANRICSCAACRGQQQTLAQLTAAGVMLPLPSSADQTRLGGPFYGSLPHSSGQ